MSLPKIFHFPSENILYYFGFLFVFEVFARSEI